MKRTSAIVLGLGLLLRAAANGAESAQWEVFETSCKSEKVYANAFTEVEVDVVFKQGEKHWKVPAFWAGGDTWKVRFAPPAQGQYTYRVECTDPANAGLNGKEQTLEVAAYTGKNPLLQHGILPVVVGGWGRGDCDGMAMAGLAGIKRHWRNLIARYGAYPTVWIIGGETGGAQWSEVTRYVHGLDPYDRPVTIHNPNRSRAALTDENLLDFDMLETSHDDWTAAQLTLTRLKASYSSIGQKLMPVTVGEACYEGHMQRNWHDVQRYLFWSTMLSGSAGHTYGAAGIWHVGVEGDPGHVAGWFKEQAFDWTTWREGMNYPGSTQLGLGKKLLEQYPWARFEPHPEWAPGCFAAGIPGGMRVIYLPRRNIYNWSGFTVNNLQPGVPYSALQTPASPGSTLRIRRGGRISGSDPISSWAMTFRNIGITISI